MAKSNQITRPDDPAYPIFDRDGEINAVAGTDGFDTLGLTKREHMATALLSAMIMGKHGLSKHECALMAKGACAVADLLIEELNK